MGLFRSSLPGKSYFTTGDYIGLNGKIPRRKVEWKERHSSRSVFGAEYQLELLTTHVLNTWPLPSEFAVIPET